MLAAGAASDRWHYSVLTAQALLQVALTNAGLHSHMSHHRIETEQEAFARRIDEICRVGFPAVFAVFNAMYWSYYLQA